MSIDMQDKSGMPRSREDLIEARAMIKRKFLDIAASKIKTDAIQELLYYPTIIEALGELLMLRDVEKLRMKKDLITDRERHLLKNMLAIIHRDGGHYTEEHGLEKSVEDAMKIYYDLRTKINES